MTWKGGTADSVHCVIHDSQLPGAHLVASDGVLIAEEASTSLDWRMIWWSVR